MYVKFCNNFSFIPKVLEKYADIHVVDGNKTKGVLNMYSMWPGCYSFMDELKLFAMWFKEQTEAFVFRICELDRMLHS